MTVLMRPRLLRSTDGPAIEELRLQGFEELSPASLGHQLVLWSALPPQFLEVIGAVQDTEVRIHVGPSGILLGGPPPSLSSLASRLRALGFPDEAALLSEVVDSPSTVRRLRCRSKVLTLDRPHLVGILNVTP